MRRLLLVGFFSFVCSYATASERKIGSQAALAVSDLIGTWQVQMTATRSTCPQVKAGDVRAEQWIVSSSQDRLKIKVVGNDNTTSEYVGGIEAASKLVTLDAATLSQAVVELLMGDKGTLAGTRMVAGINAAKKPCIMHYTVTAKR
jgi:hypothetical protein